MTMLDSTATSRTRSPRAAIASPRPVQEKAATVTRNDEHGNGGPRDRHVKDERAEDERDEGAQQAIDDDRQGPSEEERDASRGAREQQAEGLGVALAADRVAHGEQAGDGRVLDGVADEEERVIADSRRPSDEGEEHDLQDGSDDERGNEDPRD